MKAKIMVLNILKYETDKGKGTRVSYVLLDEDKISDSENFKGLTQVDSFYYNHEVFDLLPLGIVGKVIEATFVARPNYKNALKVTHVLESVVFNGRTITLVQSEKQ